MMFRRGQREEMMQRRFSLMPLLAFALPWSRVAVANDLIPPKVNTETPTGVSLSDTTFNYSATDLSIGPLVVERFHLGGLFDNTKPYNGIHMSNSLDIYLDLNSQPPVNNGPKDPILPERYKPIVHMGSSASGTYEEGYDALQYVQPSSIEAESDMLEYNGGNYRFTTQDGTVYLFSPTVVDPANPEAHRVTSITYPNGRTMSFIYNSLNQLKEVGDNSGYAIILDYNSDGYVSAACGFDLSIAYVSATSSCTGATLKVGYIYSGALLTKFTDVFGQSTTFGYNGNEISCITPPSYGRCKISNPNASVITPSQVLANDPNVADDSTWFYSTTNVASKVRDPSRYADADPTGVTTVTDPVGNKSYYAFSNTSPYEFIDPLGRHTNYRYTGGNDFEGQVYPDPAPILATGKLLTEVDYPDGNKYAASFSGPRNAITLETWTSKSGTATETNSYTYQNVTCSAPATPQNCAKPMSKIDGNGNKTNFTYFDFGAVHTEMDPAPATNSARPLRIYAYTQMYAYILSSPTGSLVPATGQIWELTSETQCQTLATSNPSATCDPSAPQIVKTYQYGAPNTAHTLLLRGQVVDSGAGNLNLRTCYGYDNYGNKISETKPNANLASCP
jgi:hypothetical protein